MKELFLLDLLRTSLIVGIAVCLLTATTQLWNGRFSSKARNQLWLLLAALLLVGPFLKLPQDYRIEIPVAIREQVQQPQSGFETNIELPRVEQIPAMENESAEYMYPPVNQTMGSEESIRNNRVSVGIEIVALCLWAFGCAAFVMWQVLGEVIFRSKVRRWTRPEADERLHELYQTVLPEVAHPPLARCAAIETPMLAGLLRPKLLLPRNDYTESEITYIFQHELYHWKNKDLWRKLLYLVVNAVHWFNPAIWLLRHEAERDLERVCDEHVVSQVELESRKAYAAVLLNVTGAVRGPAVSTSLSSDAKSLKARLENILIPNKRSGRGWAVCMLLIVCCALLLSGCFTSKEGASVTADESTEAAMNASYSILLLGTVGEQQSYDAVMQVTYDLTEPSLHVLSIPRDTYFEHAETIVKKPGAYGFASVKNGYEMKEMVSELTGIPVDYSVTVDVEVLAQLVDFIGGVECNVPQNMDYDDPYQDLSIHLKAGQQQLNGEQFVGLLRYRRDNNPSEGYQDGDFGRIAVQQQAILSLVEKVGADFDIDKMSDLLMLTFNNVVSDIPSKELIDLGTSFIYHKIPPESVTFSILPGEYGQIWNETYKSNLSYWIPKTEADDEIMIGDSVLLINEINRSQIGKELHGKGIIVPESSEPVNDIDSVSGGNPAQLPENKFFHTSASGEFIWNGSIREICVSEGCVTPEMIFPNGAMAVITRADSEGWNCEIGDKLVCEFEKYPLESNKNQGLAIGYIADGIIYEPELYQSSLEVSYEVDIENDGEYYIYIVGASSDPVSLKEGEVVFKSK